MSDDLRQTGYYILFVRSGNLWISLEEKALQQQLLYFPNPPSILHSPLQSHINPQSASKILHQFHQYAPKTFWIQNMWPKHHLKIFCRSNPQKRQYVWWCGGLFDHIMNMSEVSHSVSFSFALHNVFCQAMESLPLRKKSGYCQRFCSSAPIFTL